MRANTGTLKRLSGFTMVEFIMVIIVISILSVAAYLAWPGLVVSLDAQAAQLASDIRYAQVLSMTKGQRYRLVRTSSTSYQIVNSSGTPILLARGSTTMILGYGISFGAFTNLPNNLIAFNGKGVPYIDAGSPGTPLSSTAGMSLVAEGSSKTVLITPNTGRVIIA